MFGHAQRLEQPLGARQKQTIAAVLVIIAVLAGWAIAHSRAAPASSHGCVNLVVAGSTGGGLISHCGAAARSFCAAERRASDALAARADVQCRLAGLGPRRSS